MSPDSEENLNDWNFGKVFAVNQIKRLLSTDSSSVRHSGNHILSCLVAEVKNTLGLDLSQKPGPDLPEKKPQVLRVSDGRRDSAVILNLPDPSVKYAP